MATLKIDPKKLPYRGEPTRDIRPAPKIPPHLKVRVLDSPWTKRPHHGREERKQSAIKNSKRKRRKDLWTPEQDEMALQMYLSGKSCEEIAKAVGRKESATYEHLGKLRRERGIKPLVQKTYGACYSQEDDQLIVRMHNQGANAGKIAKKLGRTSRSISVRLSILRAKGYKIKDHRLERSKA